MAVAIRQNSRSFGLFAALIFLSVACPLFYRLYWGWEDDEVGTSLSPQEVPPAPALAPPVPEAPAAEKHIPEPSKSSALSSSSSSSLQVSETLPATTSAAPAASSAAPATPSPSSPQSSSTPVPSQLSVEIVVASTKRENTSWVHEYLPDWSHKVYVVDDPNHPLTVPLNKGREAMVFLTYLIDYYDRLPDVAVFMHAGRYQWHNDDPNYDAVPTLRRLNATYVRDVGYANLRCVWLIGCPAELHPYEDELAPPPRPPGYPADKPPPLPVRPDGKPLTTHQIFRQAFSELLPEREVPRVVAVSCCSQFAVSREAVHQRPRGDYVRFRQWLISTHYADDLSGRVLEYIWHIIFGREAVHCPKAEDCYCNLWGLCDLKCTQDQCEGRYKFPPSAAMPKGWPRIGFEGEERNYTEPFPLTP
ncbi:hypothetical protein VTK73DRAFT_6588 [Phialemonium thermophilum]|uniref:Uncharacterized protein n=1 Tax=Phialemonium thermophilum TaxID=223376 RepID=A0ABR3WIS1_9PEZI